MYIVEYLEPGEDADNGEWEIDAQLCGNEMRFINYPNEGEEANVEAVCIIRKGRHKVGVDIHICTLTHKIYTHTRRATHILTDAHSHTGI
jgi:hypothetical protein